MLISVNIDVTDYQLDCVLSGCFEGGSNYWIDCVEVVDGNFKGTEFASDVISKGGELLIDSKKLTKDMLVEGVRLFITDSKRFGNDWFDKMDGSTNDMVLQYALFGEVLYG